MKRINPKYQNGFSLLIFVVMLMTIGGFVLVGYGQGLLKDVEAKKFEHNDRVLKEAKQALLQFAYNYPVTNSEGPGRLPCADIDNDGDANTAFGDCITLGRLPWNEPNLHLYDIRDADGQRLWYAVSDAFATNVGGGNTINSDASGTITVRDQAGKVIYDGSSNLAKYGVAAVIIAPGDITAKNGVAQDRSVANGDDPFDHTEGDDTDKDTDPGIKSASNYLDLVLGTEDNADFTQDSAVDGFILGPVDDQSTNAVNDQMIIITAAEVIEVAEKATLQAYRTAIKDYLAATTPANVYPWLYNYKVATVAGLSEDYPALADFTTAGTGEKDMYLDNFGRIPSIFADYFTETNSQPIETELGGSISWGGLLPVIGIPFLDGPPAIVFPIPNKLADVSFIDIDPDVVGKDGGLTATFLTPETLTYDIYFWEYDHDEPYIGGWSLCAAPADQLSDCSRDSSGNPIPGLPNDFDLDILHLTVTLDFNGVVNFNMDYSNAPVIAPPVAASSTAHASISATYAGADIISLPFLSATYERDEHYHAGDIALDPGDGSYVTGPLNMNVFGQGPVSLKMRYYPELPDWAFSNGWHNSVMMAYAENYRPDILGACTEGTDCIQINNLAGNNDSKISILTIAGQHNWIDDAPPLNDFTTDITDVFDAENADILDIDGTEYLFDRNELGGNDKILVIEEI